MNIVKKILDTFSGQDDGILVTKCVQGYSSGPRTSMCGLLLNGGACVPPCTGHVFEASFRFMQYNRIPYLHKIHEFSWAKSNLGMHQVN